jgi:hypothetical protein
MKGNLIRNFVIGTFVSLYLLVSVISTIHVIDFFELSNPYWLAVTLAIGFEVGAAASLASLVILKKMNKTLVWALFITITLMQMQGNMYYAFINMDDYTSWAELFNLIEEEPIFQKRVLAAISGAILPLVALGFIKSLVDYIKPEDEDEEILTDGSMDDDMLTDGFETKPSQEYFEDKIEDMRDVVDSYDNLQDEIESHIVKQPTKEEREQILADMMARDQEIGLYDDWDATLQDGLEDEEWDEDHALDQVMNDMVADMTEEEIQDIIAEDTPEELQEKPWWDGPVAELETQPEEAPEDTIKEDDMLDILEQEVDEDIINPTSVGSIVKERGLINEDKLWDEAMAKKAKEDMELFIKKKNENK